MRLALVTVALSLLLTGGATAFDLVNADGTNVDPDGHIHAGLVDPTTLECGTYLSGSALTGSQTGESAYSFSELSASPEATGRALDHSWVQAAGSTEVVWDMGRPVQAVVAVPSIDHGGDAIPGEAFEYTAFGADSPDPGAPNEQGDIYKIYDQGFSGWVSDDYAARWTFAAPHRYVHVIAGGPGAVLADGDAELDAVCTDVPPPASGQNANAAPAAGVVTVKQPGSNTFAPLTSADQIPVGSVLDATDGRVVLTTASAAGAVQKASFQRGQFTVLQKASTSGLTELKLAGGRTARTCRATHAVVHSARKKLSKAVLRQLLGRGHGVYKADGRHANLTIHGTRFLIQDRCDGTFVKVTEGQGDVLDKHRNRHVRLRAGQSYLARAG